MVDMRIAIVRDGTFKFKKEGDKLFVLVEKELNKEETDMLVNSFHQEIASIEAGLEPIQDSLNLAVDKKEEYLEKNTGLLKEKLKEMNERIKSVNDTLNTLKEVLDK